MEQEIQPQQPPTDPVESTYKKLIGIFIFGLIILIVVASYVAFNKNDVNSDLGEEIVGPLTIKPLMQLIEADQPSKLYQDSITLVQSYEISTETHEQLSEIIKKSDPEITSRDVENRDYLFSILHANENVNFVLYMMTPTETYCVPPGNMDSGCNDAKLKILNLKDNSIHLLTNNFADGQGDVYLDEKSKLIIVFTDSNYEIFNLTEPYSLRQSTPTGFSSLLLNEFVASYNPDTFNWIIEDILRDRKIDCTITNVEVQNTLNNTFDSSHFSLSPNGNKVILLKGNNRFLWDDISNQWSSNSASCLNNVKEVELSEITSVLRIGIWYANANYFAYSDFGSDTFVYDFNAQKQIFYMPWDDSVGAGYMNNFGYHDSTNINQEGLKVVVVPEEKQISIYFEMSDSKRYLVGNYPDEFSTEAFYQSTQRYPVNSAGGNTSGILYNVGGKPRAWVRVKQDNIDSNLYHLLVLDGYKVRQALDILVTP